MVKQVRIIGIVGDGQHYVGRGQGGDEAGWHAVQGGGGIQCILGKKGVAGGGEQRYFGRNGLTFWGGGAVRIPIAFAKKCFSFARLFFSKIRY